MTTDDELAMALLAQLEMARRLLAGRGDLMPTLIVESPTSVEIIALADWSTVNKRAAMYALGRKYGRGARAVYFLADAWVADMEREAGLRRVQQGGPPVREMPGAREALTGVAMTDAGETVAVQQVYARGPDGLVFEEPHRSDTDETLVLVRAYVVEPFWLGAAIWRR